jgi:hypothetical protein
MKPVLLSELTPSEYKLPNRNVWIILSPGQQWRISLMALDSERYETLQDALDAYNRYQAQR